MSASLKEAYRVPRHLAPVRLKLDANESTSASFAADVSDLGLDEVWRYPQASRLEATLADYWGVDPSEVLVTAGADDALCRIAEFAGEKRWGLHVPTFGMLLRYIGRAGGTVSAFRWERGPFPTEAFCEETAGAEVVGIVSPNNPTGGWVETDDLDEIRQRFPQALLVIDQAYGEFDGDRLTRWALGKTNVVVTRTFSKAWGMAALRVGYAMGDPSVIERLRALGQPYAVSGLSLHIVEASFAQWQQGTTRSVVMESKIAQIESERSILHDLLSSLGQTPRRSKANFVWGEFENPQFTFDALCSLGVRVRRFEEETLKSSLRITCPGNADLFADLQTSIEVALRPQALLVDLDGVVIEVSGSYRKTIVQTAKAFGVEVSLDEIEAAKRAGDANDDWQLTHSLLRLAGVEVSLEAVVAQFESIYQGSSGEPGLKRFESLLPSRAELERLGADLPIAAVTGRPRADALEALEREAIADLFSEVIAREDTRLMKPDPEPVCLAMQRLGVSRAWMIGDTVDDMAAARGAGVVGIGFLQNATDEDRQALMLAGAGCVVTSWPEFFRVTQGVI